MIKNIVSLFFLLTFIASCSNETNTSTPDVSTINIDFKTIRFDQKLLRSVNNENTTTSLNSLQAKHPVFYNLYFKSILPISDENGFEQNLKGFFNEESIKELTDTTEIVFNNFDKTNSELKEAFKYFKYYFPDFQAPNIYTFISEFAYQVFLFDNNGKDGVGIGLDMFLNDYPYPLMARENPAFSSYISRTFNKEHLPQKVVSLLLDDRLEAAKGNKLIDHMIHNGKKLYLLNKILPHTKKHILLEYTPEQTKWVEQNELEMWSFFFDQNLFYESNMMKINKYINHSPDSPGMPDEAPGRTANYLGWQIVEAYMKKFPETTISQLIHMNDSQLFLEKSRYKPKRN